MLAPRALAEWSRPAWAAAYEGRPRQREHRAAGHLAEMITDAAAADCECSALLGYEV